MRCGLPRGAVWDLCWRELYRELMCWAERVRQAHNDRVRLAWNTAMFQRAQKPKLNDHLWLIPSEKVQSFDDQKAMLAKLSKNYGGRVQTVRLNG